MAANMPTADVDVDVALVERLLRSQHPDLAGPPLVELANGWDNVMYRLGEDLVVRVPRRREAAILIEHEQLTLPRLAPRLPIPVPVPVRHGRPDGPYPYPWSVLPWFDGRPLGAGSLGDARREARRLGAFLGALHVAAPAEAPPNPYRGHHVAENDGILRDRVASTGPEIDRLVDGGADRVLARWAELIEIEPFGRPATWLHGDLHALNLVVGDGAIVAVVDWGDVCAGDPACDLSVAWTLFEPGERQTLRGSATVHGEPVDDATWRRAEAWALHFAVTYLANSADNAEMHAIATKLLSRLCP